MSDYQFVSRVNGQPDILFSFEELIDAFRGLGSTSPWPTNKKMQDLIMRLDWAGMYQFELIGGACDTCDALKKENEDLKRQVEMWAGMVIDE
jgi:hypothetical protein